MVILQFEQIQYYYDGCICLHTRNEHKPSYEKNMPS